MLVVLIRGVKEEKACESSYETGLTYASARCELLDLMNRNVMPRNRPVPTVKDTIIDKRTHPTQECLDVHGMNRDVEGPE